MVGSEKKLSVTSDRKWIIVKKSFFIFIIRMKFLGAEKHVAFVSDVSDALLSFKFKMHICIAYEQGESSVR